MNRNLAVSIKNITFAASKERKEEKEDRRKRRERRKREEEEEREKGEKREKREIRNVDESILCVMKKVVILTVLVMATVMASAQMRNDAQMRAIAIEQLQLSTGSVSLARQSQAYSLFTGEKGGFVVVSRDAAMPQVLGYSSSSVDPANLPDGLQWWLDAVAARAAAGETAATTTSALAEEIPNFMPSQWGQSVPYNMFCPTMSGKRTLTGCVATALGQALYLYRYPSAPVGTNIFYINNAGPYYDDFATSYNWAAMKDYYTPNIANDDAKSVAELLRDCGYATGMNYSTGGSEAFCYKQAVALTSNFSYPTANIRYATRKFYSNDEWMYIIYRELKGHRPVLYTGLEAQEYNADGSEKFREGHSFVFSGMDADGRLYVNWGWNGMADGFFDFSDLAPAGIQNHAETYHFNYEQEMVYGITPDASPSPMALKYSDFGTKRPVYYLELTGTNLYLDVDFINYYYLPFSGSFDIIFDSAGDQGFKTTIIDTSSIGVISTLSGFHITTAINIGGLSAGVYRVFIASKSTDDTHYQPLRCEGGPIYFELTKSASGSMTISEAKSMDYRDYTSSGISVPVMASDKEVQGIYTLGGQRVSSSAQRGICIVRQGGKVKKILNK